MISGRQCGLPHLVKHEGFQAHGIQREKIGIVGRYILYRRLYEKDKGTAIFTCGKVAGRSKHEPISTTSYRLIVAVFDDVPCS